MVAVHDRAALGCSALIEYVPRTTWSQLRGSVRTSIAPEIDDQMSRVRQGVGGASRAEIVTLLGPPNLRVEEGNAKERLYYLWLDGSIYRLEFENAQLASVVSLVKTKS